MKNENYIKLVSFGSDIIKKVLISPWEKGSRLLSAAKFEKENLMVNVYHYNTKFFLNLDCYNENGKIPLLDMIAKGNCFILYYIDNFFQPQAFFDLNKNISQEKYEYIVKIVMIDKSINTAEISSIKSESNVLIINNTFENLIETLNSISSYSLDTKLPVNQFEQLFPSEKELKSLDKFTKYSVILLGDPGSGKTSFIKRVANNSNIYENHPCNGVDQDTNLYFNFNGMLICVNFIDTNPNELYASIRKSYYSVTKCFVIIYQTSNRNSFDSIDKWYYEIIDGQTGSDFEIYLLADIGKIEDEREISTEEGEKKAKELNIKYKEISIRYNINIYEIIACIINDMSAKEQSESILQTRSTIHHNKCIIF